MARILIYSILSGLDLLASMPRARQALAVALAYEPIAATAKFVSAARSSLSYEG